MAAKKMATAASVSRGLRWVMGRPIASRVAAASPRVAVLGEETGYPTVIPQLTANAQSLHSGIVRTTGHSGPMDLSQLILIAVAVAGAVIVGLLAIVPTVLEFPQRRDSRDRPADPTPLSPRPKTDADHEDDHRLAA